MTRISRDDLLSLQALLTSLRSTCGRRQVGVILARDGRIISSGYAGAPSGMPHCTPACLQASNALGGCNRTAHAEINAIADAAKHGRATDEAVCYTTLSPCQVCAKALKNAGIIRVVYSEAYRDPSGIDLLHQMGISCEMSNVSFATFVNLQQMYVSGGQETLSTGSSSSVKPPENLRVEPENHFKVEADNS